MTNPARFFFVESRGQHGRPFFRRCGLVFYAHSLRPIEVGDKDDLDANPPMVSQATFDAIQRETVERPGPKRHGEDKPTMAPAMLAMRPATAQEVADYIEGRRALEPRDRLQEAEEELAAAKQRLAALEDRLMRVETSTPAPKSKERP